MQKMKATARAETGGPHGYCQLAQHKRAAFKTAAAIKVSATGVRIDILVRVVAAPARCKRLHQAGTIVIFRAGKTKLVLPNWT
jgi:hypothetical protein